MPEHYPSFPHHSQIKAYLDEYADAFGLLDRHRVRQRCCACRAGGARRLAHPRPGGRGTPVRSAGRGQRTPLGSAPARVPGSFAGESIHSHPYIDPTAPLELSGKRILVVGIGNSAADITVELSSKALRNEVTLSTRSRAWIVPKYIAGAPATCSGARRPTCRCRGSARRFSWWRRCWGPTRRCTGCRRRTTNCSRLIRPSRWNSHCGSGPAT